MYKVFHDLPPSDSSLSEPSEGRTVSIVRDPSTDGSDVSWKGTGSQTIKVQLGVKQERQPEEESTIR